VFFVLLVAYLGINRTFTMRWALRLVLFVALVVYLSIVWTSVKTEYRDFLNLGSGRQVVAVDFSDRLEKIYDLYSSIEQPELLQGVEALIKRISYVSYYAVVLSRVPDHLPHENGTFLWAAVDHIMYPRFLFPNKPRLRSDTEITEKYTGISLIRPGGRHTNVPMGYMVEKGVGCMV